MEALYIKEAMVIGPTPPGTGEIYFTEGDTKSKSTSPVNLPFESLKIPTSTITELLLTILHLTIFLPTEFREAEK